MKQNQIMLAKKKRVYDYLVKYIEEKGYSPTMQEICEEVGFNSKATASYYLNWLKADGAIDFVPKATRTITIGGR